MHRERERSESAAAAPLLVAADASCINVHAPLEHVEDWVALTDGGFERAPPHLGTDSVAAGLLRPRLDDFLVPELCTLRLCVDTLRARTQHRCNVLSHFCFAPYTQVWQ